MVILFSLNVNRDYWILTSISKRATIRLEIMVLKGGDEVNPKETRYLTAEEFAERLRERGFPFTTTTIRNWIRSGKIKAIRPGARAWYISESEIERLLADEGEGFTLRLAAA